MAQHGIARTALHSLLAVYGGTASHCLMYVMPAHFPEPRPLPQAVTMPAKHTVEASLLLTVLHQQQPSTALHNSNQTCAAMPLVIVPAESKARHKFTGEAAPLEHGGMHRRSAGAALCGRRRSWSLSRRRWPGLTRLRPCSPRGMASRLSLCSHKLVPPQLPKLAEQHQRRHGQRGGGSAARKAANTTQPVCSGGI